VNDCAICKKPFDAKVYSGYTAEVCDECIERHRLRAAAQREAGFSDDGTCPVCEKLLDEDKYEDRCGWYECDGYGDIEGDDVECHHCGAHLKLTVEREYRVEYRIVRAERVKEATPA